MRRHPLRPVLAAAVAALALAAPAGVAAETTPARVAGYAFPVVGGTPEWASFTSHDEMVAATQVPADVLASMSTPALVQTVLDYPLFLDMFAFTSPQTGFDRVVENFNGLRVLFERPDAADALLARYRSLVAEFRAGVPAADLDARFLELTKTEWLIAQPNILDEIPEDQGQVLVDLVLARLDAIRYGDGYVTINGPSGEESGLLVVARVLDFLATEHDTRTFVRDGIALTNDVLLDVEVAATSRVVIPEATAGEVIPTNRDYSSTVKTPKGTSVPVMVMEAELTSSQITSYNNYVATNYPQATRETNASRKYNCHSYAWYSQSTTNTRWMNSPGDDKYWTDGSYSYWHPPLVAKSILRYSYVYGDHSAYWTDSTGLRSKWGQLPRMKHDWWYSPYDDSAIDTYYRTGT